MNEESIQGATRFTKGQGRHGGFHDIDPKKDTWSYALSWCLKYSQLCNTCLIPNILGIIWHINYAMNEVLATYFEEFCTQ